MSDGLPEDCWATFSAPISETTLNQLMTVFSGFYRLRPRRIHLLFQSVGGSVGDGAALYCYIRNSPVPVILYNVGNVASMATIAYLGGVERVCSAYGMFMIHRPANQSRLNARTARLAIDSLMQDEDRMAAILAERTTVPEGAWRSHDTDLVVAPQLAMEWGIATRIDEWRPPAGASIFNVVIA